MAYSAFLSLIGLIIFSIFLIRSWLPILYISIFYLASNGLYIFWNYFIFELYKLQLNEFLFSTLIFNYNIFLAFAFLIKYCFNYIIKYIKERIDDNSNNLQKQKYFYLKNFIILLIQFTLIFPLTVVGFQYKFNEILIESDVSLEDKYIPSSIVIFLSAIIIACLYQKKTLKCLITFHVIFPPFVIYYSFLFSSFIGPKYIIIGLSLIAIQIISMLFNIFLKKFEVKHFLLFSALLRVIGLVFFSIFWIQSWTSILYMSIFYIISNLIYITIIYEINEKCISGEYLYSTLIFNYSIFLIIIFFISKTCEKMCSFCEKRMYDSEISALIKIFSILLIQYIIIIFFVWIGFSSGWNSNLKENFTAIGWCIGIVTVGNFILSGAIIKFLFADDDNGTDSKGLFLFCILFYIAMMIIYFYGLSRSLEEKYILAFIFIVFFDLLAAIIGLLFVGDPNFVVILLSCIFSNLATIIPFHFCWLDNNTALIWLSILSILIDIYLSFLSSITKKYSEDSIFFSVSAFNYGLFGIISGLIILIFETCECL